MIRPGSGSIADTCFIWDLYTRVTSPEFMSQHHVPYQFRGYVSRNQRHRLEDMLGRCALLYNAALQERRDAWRMKGKGLFLHRPMQVAGSDSGGLA